MFITRNTLSPQYRPINRAIEPQGTIMMLRVKDRGESERRPVIGRIGAATLPHAKAGRLPRGLALQEI